VGQSLKNILSNLIKFGVLKKLLEV